MFNTPIKANDIELAIFTCEHCGNDMDKLEFEANAWLKNQPNNIVIHDIIYWHSGKTPTGKEIASLLLVSAPTKDVS